jgi:hypothetical protein
MQDHAPVANDPPGLALEVDGSQVIRDGQRYLSPGEAAVFGPQQRSRVADYKTAPRVQERDRVEGRLRLDDLDLPGLALIRAH